MHSNGRVEKHRWAHCAWPESASAAPSFASQVISNLINFVFSFGIYTYNHSSRKIPFVSSFNQPSTVASSSMESFGDNTRVLYIGKHRHSFVSGKHCEQLTIVSDCSLSTSEPNLELHQISSNQFIVGEKLYEYKITHH